MLSILSCKLIFEIDLFLLGGMCLDGAVINPFVIAPDHQIDIRSFYCLHDLTFFIFVFHCKKILARAAQFQAPFKD